jgi:hypothetical protein
LVIYLVNVVSTSLYRFVPGYQTDNDKFIFPDDDRPNCPMLKSTTVRFLIVVPGLLTNIHTVRCFARLCTPCHERHRVERIEMTLPHDAKATTDASFGHLDAYRVHVRAVPQDDRWAVPQQTVLDELLLSCRWLSIVLLDLDEPMPVWRR